MKPTRTARTIGQTPGAATRLFTRLAEKRRRELGINRPPFYRRAFNSILKSFGL